MMIDENRVIAKSKTYTRGFKGIAPSFKPSGNKTRDAILAAIGIAVVAAFLVGTAALVYSLTTEGETAVKRIASKNQQGSQYVEITFKPKQGGE